MHMQQYAVTLLCQALMFGPRLLCLVPAGSERAPAEDARLKTKSSRSTWRAARSMEVRAFTRCSKLAVYHLLPQRVVRLMQRLRMSAQVEAVAANATTRER